MATTKPHLSASALGMLSRCGVQYEYRYVQGVKVPPGWAAHAGTGCHKAAEADLKHKAAEGSLLPVEAVLATARDATNAAWAGGVMLSADDGPEDSIRGKAVDQAVAAATVHHAELAPTINPITPDDVERKWVVSFDGFPFDLLGYFDVVEMGRVRDLKTRGRSPRAGEAATSEQLTLYSLAYWVERGEIPEVTMDVIVTTKTPKVVIQRARRTEDDLAVQLRRVERAAKIIEAGAFTPARPGEDWWCSSKWCGYAAGCPFFLRHPVSVAIGGGHGD